METFRVRLFTLLILANIWLGTTGQSSATSQDAGTCENVCRNCARAGQLADLQSRVITMENRNYYTECDVENLHERITQLEERNPVFKDCQEVFNSGQTLGGLYRIRPNNSSPFMAVCEFDEDGQWTIIQRRVDGDVSFDRDWQSYKHGFGRLGYLSTFWLGLEKIYFLSQQQAYILRIMVTDWEGNTAHADYSGFHVENEDQDYTLRYTSFVGGDAGDTLGQAMANGHNHNGRKFTTKDQDNDEAGHNCADEYHGGWWYIACYRANLNGGTYLKPPNHVNQPPNVWQGLQWQTWKPNYSLMHTTMMVKPMN